MPQANPPTQITFIGVPMFDGVVPVTSSGPQVVAGNDINGADHILLTDTAGALYITTSGSIPVDVTSPISAVVTFPNNQQVWTEGPVGVTGSVTLAAQVSVNNFPATQNVSGTVSISNSELSIDNFPAVQAVSGTVDIGNWPAAFGVSASTQLPVFSTGPVGVSGTVGAVINNWPATFGVSASATLSVSQQGQISVNNFPATQNVSGSVGAVIQNWPATIGVTGSTALRTWDGGTQGISGTVTLGSQVSVNNFPATQNISGSVGAASPSGFWFTGGTQVSGNVNLGNWPATIGVSASATLPVSQQGQISVNNFPAVQAVSGTLSITTTTPLQVWSEGPLGVTASVQLPVFSTGPVGVTGSVTLGSQVSVNNFPATQNVSGTVTAIIGNWPATIGVSASATLPVSLASQISVNNFPATQNVSGTVGAVIENWPATIGVSASSPSGFWFTGGVAVSGTLAVSGTQLTGSTFSGYPLVAGGTFMSGAVQSSTMGARYITSLQTDNSGSLLTRPARPITFSVGIRSLSPTSANPTDIITISGTNSKTVRVLQIRFSAIQSTAASQEIDIIKRSTLDSGGTSTTSTGVAWNSNFPGSLATVTSYTVNPTTLGSSLGFLASAKMFVPAGGTVETEEYVFDFSQMGGVVLNDANELLAVNWGNGAALTSGLNINCTIIWTEE
jgi:hypothetical protein